jgi:hypothetical protein
MRDYERCGFAIKKIAKCACQPCATALKPINFWPSRA